VQGLFREAETGLTLGYLARYVFKVAISDQRILEVSDGQVRFAYTKPALASRIGLQASSCRFASLPGFQRVQRIGHCDHSNRSAESETSKSRASLPSGLLS
jgi:hypothetical protein